MARGNDPGKDFDDQYYGSKRAAEYKRSRGQGVWAQDKYQERLKSRADEGQAHHGKDTCLVALAALGGLAWALGEAVGKAI
jgi:hypothetical protein